MNIVISTIKKDDIFWECQSGNNDPLIALEDVKTNNNNGDLISVVSVRNLFTHETLRLLCNHNYTQYAPRLYTYPQYQNSEMPLELIKFYIALSEYFEYLKKRNINISKYANLFEMLKYDYAPIEDIDVKTYAKLYEAFNFD